MGVSAMCGHIGGIIAPIIISVSSTWGPLPMVIYGTSVLLSAITMYFLPETLGKPLPQSLEDLVNLFR